MLSQCKENQPRFELNSFWPRPAISERRPYNSPDQNNCLGFQPAAQWRSNATSGTQPVAWGEFQPNVAAECPFDPLLPLLYWKLHFQTASSENQRITVAISWCQQRIYLLKFFIEYVIKKVGGTELPPSKLKKKQLAPPWPSVALTFPTAAKASRELC